MKSIRQTCVSAAFISLACSAGSVDKSSPAQVQQSLASTSPLLGDANGDGSINTTDMLLVSNYVQGSTLAVPLYMKAADANCNGELDYEDPLLIADVFVGTKPRLVCRGDANADGAIDVVDQLVISQYASGGHPSPFDAAAADANCDGTVTAADVVPINDLLSGSTTHVVCPPPAPGDANGDRVASVADAQVVAAYLQGTQPRPFYPKAADVDCDGLVTASDTTQINAVLSGTQPGYYCRGDINHDGQVNSIDALKISQYLQGISPSNFDSTLADIDRNGQITQADYQRVNDVNVGVRSCTMCPALTVTPSDIEAVIAGATYNYVASGQDAPGAVLSDTQCKWELQQNGAVPAIIQTASACNWQLPLNTAGNYILRMRAVSTSGTQQAWQTPIQVLGSEGDITLLPATADTQAVTIRFTITSAQVGKYFRLQTTSLAPFKAAIKLLSSNQTVAATDYAYTSPHIEFRAWTAGDYQIRFESLLQVANSWEQVFVAPAGMSVHYALTQSDMSPAASAGRSIFILRDYFPNQFLVDGVTVNKATFDFGALEQNFNQVFAALRDSFFGKDYTGFGSEIGVTYPADPAYGYGGDAGNPLRVFMWTQRTKVPYVFEHELSHVFSFAYPYVYTLTDGRNNVEAIPMYPWGWLSDPNGGGGLSADEYVRYEAVHYNGGMSAIVSPSDWHDALSRGPLPSFLRGVSGGWSGVTSVFKGYSQMYAGTEASRSGEDRARDFYMRLAASIPDASKRSAFQGQLARWKCNFYPNATYTDADNDGIVAGLDPNDHDATINQYTEECQGSRCVRDGVDNNRNLYTDESILNTAGESVGLGYDNSDNGVLGTRRKLYVTQGKTITVSASTSSKPLVVRIYKGNVPLYMLGAVPTGTYPKVAGSLESPAVSNPSVTYKTTSSDVYTFEFEGTNANYARGALIRYGATIK